MKLNKNCVHPNVETRESSGLVGANLQAVLGTDNVLPEEGTLNVTIAQLQDTIKNCVLQQLQEEVDPTITHISEDLPFAMLGVDSIGIATIAVSLEKALNISIETQNLHKYPTVRVLSEYLYSTISNAK